MQAKLLHEEYEDEFGESQRTFALIFDKGDEVITELKGFAKQYNLNGSHFTAVGAFQKATLGYFERQEMDYKHIPINEQVEVLIMAGDIVSSEDGHKVHAHVVVGKSDGSAHGGHILEAYVWPTLEVMMTEEPSYLRRKIDDETGLALIDIQSKYDLEGKQSS